jgi:hypothetical protein
MTFASSRTLAAALAASLIAGAAGRAAAQSSSLARPSLPRGRADVLLDAGLWPQAEDAFYAQSRLRPRAPVPRAALGRYLAMKGAVLPGTILIEEAQRFGLDSSLAASMLRPWRAVLEWRRIATLGRDSVVTVRPARDSASLFQMPFPRATRGGVPSSPVLRGAGYRDTVWADVVPRAIGVDSLYGRAPRVGVEVIEAFVPALDVGARRVTLHADQRAMLKTEGTRYPVLRETRQVRVLMTSGRTLTLPAALRELDPKWWQLDLVHGVLVVR